MCEILTSKTLSSPFSSERRTEKEETVLYGHPNECEIEEKKLEYLQHL